MLINSMPEYEIMVMTGDARTFARITINESIDEALRLAEVALTATNPQYFEFDEEKNMFKGKTKFSWLKGTFGAEFVILVKESDDRCIIEIYSNGWVGNYKPATKPLVDPFYNKLSQLLSSRPEIDLSVVDRSQEEIETSANTVKASNNASESANSLANEIAKLVKLKAEGTISEEEFTKMKYELIDKM